jgi:hypothetical protein
MYEITTNDIERLFGKREGPCVSIFVPACGSRSGKERSSLRLKRLLKKALELVRCADFNETNIDRIIEHLRILTKHAAFLMPRGDGLVLFLSPRVLRYYRLSRDYPESLVISDHFLLAPLLSKGAAHGRGIAGGPRRGMQRGRRWEH